MPHTQYSQFFILCTCVIINAVALIYQILVHTKFDAISKFYRFLETTLENIPNTDNFYYYYYIDLCYC